MTQTITNKFLRTPLRAGGSPQACKFWSQSQLEHDWSLWRGGLTRNPTPPSLALLVPPPLPAGENFKLLEHQKVTS